METTDGFLNLQINTNSKNSQFDPAANPTDSPKAAETPTTQRTHTTRTLKVVTSQDTATIDFGERVFDPTDFDVLLEFAETAETAGADTLSELEARLRRCFEKSDPNEISALTLNSNTPTPFTSQTQRVLTFIQMRMIAHLTKSTESDLNNILSLTLNPEGLISFKSRVLRILALPLPLVHQKLAELIDRPASGVYLNLTDDSEARRNSLLSHAPKDLFDDEGLRDSVCRDTAACNQILQNAKVRTIDEQADFVRQQPIEDCYALFVHLARYRAPDGSDDALLISAFRRLRGAFVQGQLVASKANWVWRIAGRCAALRDVINEDQQDVALLEGKFGKINRFHLYLMVPGARAVAMDDELGQGQLPLRLPQAEFPLFQRWLTTGKINQITHLPQKTLGRLYRVVSQQLGSKKFKRYFRQELCLNISDDNIAKLLQFAWEEKHRAILMACLSWLQRSLTGFEAELLPSRRLHVKLNTSFQEDSHEKAVSFVLEHASKITLSRRSLNASPTLVSFGGRRLQRHAPVEDKTRRPIENTQTNPNGWTRVADCISACARCCCFCFYPNQLAAPPVSAQPRQVSISKREKRDEKSGFTTPRDVREVDLTQCEELNDQDLFWVAENLKTVRHLSLTESALITKVGWENLTALKDLRTLRIVPGKERNFQGLGALLPRHIEHITRLCLEVNERSLQHPTLLKFLASCPIDLVVEMDVEADTWSDQPRPSSNSDSSSLELLAQHCPCLVSLNWKSKIAPTADGMRTLRESCRLLKNTSWNTLNVSDGSLPTNDQLRHIRVEHAQLSSQAVENLIKPCLDTLEELHLGQCDGLSPEIGRHLTNAHRLKRVSLFRSQLSLAPMLEPLLKKTSRRLKQAKRTEGVEIDVWQGHEREVSKLWELLREYESNTNSAKLDGLVAQCKQDVLQMLALIDPEGNLLEELVSPCLKFLSHSQAFLQVLRGVPRTVPLSILKQIADRLKPLLRQDIGVQLQGLLESICESLQQKVRKQLMALDPDVLNPRVVFLFIRLMCDPDIQRRLIQPLKQGLKRYVAEYCQPLSMTDISQLAERELPGILNYFAAKLLAMKFSRALPQSFLQLQLKARKQGENHQTVAQLLGVFLLADWHKIETEFLRQNPEVPASTENEEKEFKINYQDEEEDDIKDDTLD